MGLDPKNIDLICSLHKDKPHHLHIHFWFAEKEPRCKYRKKECEYGHKRKIQQAIIDRMHVRLNVFVSENYKRMYMSRNEALYELKRISFPKNLIKEEEVRKALIDLAKTIPKDVSFFYGKRDMKPYRAQIDKTVAKLLQYDERARKADRKFYSQIKSCPNDSFCEDLEAEYFLRQRNLVLRAVKKIKSEIYERKGQYKVNDNNLKRRLAISHRKVDKLIDGFLSSFGEESEYLSRDYTNRLQEIEEEMETEQERQKEQEARASRYNYSKE